MRTCLYILPFKPPFSVALLLAKYFLAMAILNIMSLFLDMLYIKNLRLFDTNKIDFTSRFRAFHNLPKCLLPWASKYLNNFARIAHKMSQQGL